MVKLKTETNTPAMEQFIREAFESSELLTHTCTLAFEHGQWWVTCPPCGAQWSVVDTLAGVDFEEVTRGEQDVHLWDGAS